MISQAAAGSLGTSPQPLTGGGKEIGGKHGLWTGPPPVPRERARKSGGTGARSEFERRVSRMVATEFGTPVCAGRKSASPGRQRQRRSPDRALSKTRKDDHHDG